MNEEFCTVLFGETNGNQACAQHTCPCPIEIAVFLENVDGKFKCLNCFLFIFSKRTKYFFHNTIQKKKEQNYDNLSFYLMK